VKKIEERTSEHATIHDRRAEATKSIIDRRQNHKEDIAGNPAVVRHFHPTSPAPARRPASAPTRQNPPHPHGQRICEYDRTDEILFRTDPSKRNDHTNHHHHSIVTTAS
jgi:hypothetical protein